MGYWAGTLERWYQEGLPRHPDAPTGLVSGAAVKGDGFPWRRSEPKDCSVNAHLALDKGIEKIDAEWGVWPPFEPQIFQENEEIITRARTRWDYCHSSERLGKPASPRGVAR